MKTFIKLFSEQNSEISRFIEHFYSGNNKLVDSSILEFKIEFENPIEMTDMIGVFIENMDDYKINMWICLDENIYISINNYTINNIIKYLLERYPN